MPLFGKKKDKPENRLEELLLGASNDVTKRAQFYKALLDSDVFCIGEPKGSTAPDKEGSFQTTENTEFSFYAMDLKGEKVGAIFSSLARMKEALGDDFKNARWIRTSARNMFKAIHPQLPRIFLNPRCSFGHEFNDKEIQLVIEGRLSELDSNLGVQSRGDYETRQPQELPQAFMDVLMKYFDERGDIADAFVSEVSVPSRNEPWHLMFGIRLRNRAKTRFGEILAGIDRIAKAKLPSDKRMVDIIEVVSEANIEKWFGQTQPFYKKN